MRTQLSRGENFQRRLARVVIKEFFDNEEQLRKKVALDKRGNIVIDIGSPYRIELSRCNTHEKIVDWVLHLSEKVWITPAIIQRFIELAAQENGLAIHET